eukprot:227529_1
MPTIFNSNINISSVQIFLRSLRNKTLTIHLESTATVYELKDFIERKYNIPIETQQLFHQGRLLKNKRSLSTYKLNGQTTMTQPILLTQSFKVDVFISTKVLSLHSLAIKNKSNNKLNKKKKLNDNNNKELPSQQIIQCSSTTTIQSILKQLNLSNLSHLLKVCVGAETKDITDMNQRIIDIPNLLNDGIISILFSARWFLDRTVNIATFNSKVSQTIQKSINSSKLSRSCQTFNRLNYQFEKTQTFILSQFEQLENMSNKQTHEINKAYKWINNLMEHNMHKQLDENTDKLLNQLHIKIEQLSNAFKISDKKWNKKRSQIVEYFQNTIRKCEDELMCGYKLWNTKDIIEWLEYMDNRIILNNNIIKQFETANITGYNLLNINDLSLKLMGIEDINIRQLIVAYINQLLEKYNNDIKHNNNISYDNDSNDDINGEDRNVCCVCVQKEVNTAIVPCGHAVYCTDCSKASMKHNCNRCPICRTNVGSIIHIFKAGFNSLQI